MAAAQAHDSHCLAKLLSALRAFAEVTRLGSGSAISILVGGRLSELRA
jgi:hypothetical protein